MTSVDEDDQLIYIEVESTKSADPTEAFYTRAGSARTAAALPRGIRSY
jgi:hypothetical protein